MTIPSATPVRGTFLSAAVEASVDVRKACNTIKRSSHIGAASLQSKIDPLKAVELSHAMAMSVLESIGFDVQNSDRVQSVMPMMMEATSGFLYEAITADQDPSSVDDAMLQEAAKKGVMLLTEVAKSRAIAKMIEPEWPTDLDATTALRLVASSAMANVSVEIARFDFAHSASECIQESSKLIVSSALVASLFLAPKNASGAARLMLTQSLITSASKVFAACWRSESDTLICELDRLTDAQADVRLDELAAQPLSELTKGVASRFGTAYAAIMKSTMETLNSDAALMAVPHLEKVAETDPKVLTDQRQKRTSNYRRTA